MKANEDVGRSLRKFGFVYTRTSDSNLDEYLEQATNIDIEYINSDVSDISNYNEDGLKPLLETVSRIENNDTRTKNSWTFGFISKFTEKKEVDIRESGSGGSLMLSSTNGISKSLIINLDL